MSIFDEKIDRRHTGSMKWDVTEKELPMWVADMDFQTAPQITEAIIKRAQHGVFGYTLIEDDGMMPIRTGGKHAMNGPSKKNG